MKKSITKFMSAKEVAEYLNCSEAYANKIIASLNKVFVKQASHLFADNNGKMISKEETIWTLEEYNRFIKELESDPIYYNAFQLLFWGGLRTGEILALTPADIDFTEKTIQINKSYQRSVGGYCIRTPLTKNGIRTITIPENLIPELKKYINGFCNIDENARLFPITQETLSRKLKKVSETTNLKKTTLAGMRHSAFIKGGKS